MLTTENLQYFTSKFYNKVKNDFVFKEDGKCLSTNDYTDEDKDKLTNAYTKTEVDNKL